MSERQIVLGSEKRRLSNAKQVGPANPDEIVEVTVLLRLPEERVAELASHAAVSARGKTPHLSRELYEQRFSAPIEALTRIERFAESFGLKVIEASAERRAVSLSGTVAALGRAFGVTLSKCQHADGTTFRGRSGAITVPNEIADIVDAVLGLDDRPVARPHSRRLEARDAPSAFSPVDVARQYQFPETGAPGQGQCIALIELGGGFRLAELSTYFQTLGLTMPKVSAVAVDGGQNSPGVDTNADGEVLLDIEVAGAVAPAAGIVAYFAPNTDRGFLDAVSRAVHDKHNPVTVISISWGGPEAGWTEQSLRAFDQLFAAASALGITVCAAAGDQGSTDGLRDGAQHVDFPASNPYVLACGGTRLVVDGDGTVVETVWNDAPDSATGGGISDVFALPTWQAKIGVPSKNAGGRTGRGVPDVAGDADPVTGYKVLVDGQQMVIGGTSAVAPLWAGLVALLNQQLGRKVGQLQPFLYAHPEVFRDITDGNNGAYAAGTGWDACTGLGSPKGSALLKALAAAG